MQLNLSPDYQRLIESWSKAERSIPLTQLEESDMSEVLIYVPERQRLLALQDNWEYCFPWHTQAEIVEGPKMSLCAKVSILSCEILHRQRGILFPWGSVSAVSTDDTVLWVSFFSCWHHIVWAPLDSTYGPEDNSISAFILDPLVCDKHKQCIITFSEVSGYMGNIQAKWGLIAVNYAVMWFSF